MYRRSEQKFTKRLETALSSGSISYRGTSSDLSVKGLSVRTQHGFVHGTIKGGERGQEGKEGPREWLHR
ncbi:MAG TPA: hypothetical protein VFG09_14670 [Thermodesulfovibrionales bacterium]|jgi:hypothetical protein|nr:hypothetical protein [Thermodesulfovibrionales bacterium]